MQRSVYFVSSLLQGARSRYSGVQKLLFGLLMASRKMRHYFQAHEITVVTRFPLQRKAGDDGNLMCLEVMAQLPRGHKEAEEQLLHARIS